MVAQAAIGDRCVGVGTVDDAKSAQDLRNYDGTDPGARVTVGDLDRDAEAIRVCMGSPPCDDIISEISAASTGLDSLSWSPSSRKGRSWKGLAVERSGNETPVFPALSRSRPVPSTMEMMPE